MAIQVLMPALSPTMTEGTLAKWLKKEGDKIEPGTVIAEIETDKATMEVEAIDEGILGKIFVKEGTENVSVGSLIAAILEDGEDESCLNNLSSGSSSEKYEKENLQDNHNLTSQTLVSNESTANNIKNSSERIFASPLAKRIASQNSVDLLNIKGTGPKGRIIKLDVEEAILNNKNKPNLLSSNNDNLSHSSSEFRLEPVTGMRKVIAKRLLESKQTIPHFYLSVDCNLDELMKVRNMVNNSQDVLDKCGKVSVNDFVIKACAAALYAVPEANSSWSDEGVKYYNSIDISVAVAIDGGLITPIIKNANLKSLSDISKEMKELAKKAREGKLLPHEYQGGGFSISNLGMFGVKNFKAIVNPPQTCILAVGASEKRVVVKNDQMVISEMVDLTLSCDHRVVDGAVGARFLSSLKNFLQNPMTILV